MSTCIATRTELIDLLEKRIACPLGRQGHIWSEPGKYDERYGLGKYSINQFAAHNPCLVFSHPDALGYDLQGNRKRMGELKAYDIPYWGKASDIINSYYL